MGVSLEEFVNSDVLLMWSLNLSAKRAIIKQMPVRLHHEKCMF